MNNGVKFIFAFVAGAAAGSVVAWKLLEKKYADIAQAEIDSVKEVFSKMESYEDNEVVEPKEEPATVMKNIISEHYGNIEDLEKGGSKFMSDPVIISPSEFNDIDEDEFDIVSLTCYADKVVTDEYGEVIDNIEDLIGTEALNSFGEYEDDSVFVRNDELGRAYEILLDDRKYFLDVASPSNLTDDE